MQMSTVVNIDGNSSGSKNRETKLLDDGIMSSFMVHEKAQMQETDNRKALSRFDPLLSSKSGLQTTANLTNREGRDDIFKQNSQPSLSGVNHAAELLDVFDKSSRRYSAEMYNPITLHQRETTNISERFGSLTFAQPAQKGQDQQIVNNDSRKNPFSRNRITNANGWASSIENLLNSNATEKPSEPAGPRKPSRSHRRSKSIENSTNFVKLALPGHRKTKSVHSLLDSDIMTGDGILKSISPKRSNTHTPSHSPPGGRRTVKSITPSSLLRGRTKSKDGNTPKTSKTLISKTVMPDGKMPGLNLPLLAKPSPTSFLNNSDSFALRTSEQDPSAHQVELPKVDEVLLSIKLCALMDNNRDIENDFDLTSLVGYSNITLKNFMSSGQSMSTLQKNHLPVIEQLLACNDGVSVGGYAAKSAEVIIFDIPSRSQIIVVFRGNDDQQCKPIKKPRQSTVEDFHSGYKVPVLSAFKEAYFELEPMFSAIVDKLTDANPFAQVVFCGHSFGGALATMASIRYACNRSMMRVAVHAFGSPRVGALGFRQLANSLSNLRIIRVELKNDWQVDLPADGATKWDHAGHSIIIGKTVTAHRFDKNRPSTNNIQKKILETNIFRKNEKPSSGYLQALETCALKDQWFEAFSGEDVGQGVRGKGDEKRLIS